MREQLESLVSAGKIGRQHVEPLLGLLECGYCMHRGWGFGRIRELDPVFGRLIIDFPERLSHPMDVKFAVGALHPVPRDHILVRKAEDAAGLRQLAATDHKELVALVLRSHGGQATVDQIQQALVPDVIDSDWRKWWEVARRELKRDGHFQVPLKRTQPVVYQAQVVTPEDRLLTDFQAAKGLKARLLVAAEVLKSLPDLPDARTVVEAILPLLNNEIQSHQRTQPALAIEGVLMRDDLMQTVSLAPVEGQTDAAAIWTQVTELGKVLEAVSAPKHHRALESFKAARPEDWHTALLAALNEVSSRLCGECVRLLEAEHLDPLKEHLRRLINQHSASTELLLWLARERSDLYADILGPEVFRAMLTAIERDQFNEKKSSRLQDFVLDDAELLPALIESADIEVVKDLTRALKFSSGFDDVDRRSLLARIVKVFPAVQSLISGEAVRQENALVVSWSSLHRRKEEYRELVEKKIPANSHDIAVARSYGDLRENHEYKAAKEMHRLLMQRKAELERDLGRAQGSDFANPRTDVVSMGTQVRVTELGARHEEVFHLLGAWDFDPDKHLISYLSPIGQALLGRRVGDETTLELEGHQARYRIEAIDPSPLAAATTAAPDEPIVVTDPGPLPEAANPPPDNDRAFTNASLGSPTDLPAPVGVPDGSPDSPAPVGVPNGSPEFPPPVEPAVVPTPPDPQMPVPVTSPEPDSRVPPAVGG